MLSKQANFNDSQLADTIWCNDKSVVTDTTFNPGNSLYLGTNYGYAKNPNYYSAFKRLVSNEKKAGGDGPSLICPNDNNGGKLSKFTVNDTNYGNGALNGYAKIGFLTADEVAFAGGAYIIGNSTYYLNENTNNSVFWVTLSPSMLAGDGASILLVHSKYGELTGDTVTHGGISVRPSLSLVSTTKVTGEGTATNPYKVKM